MKIAVTYENGNVFQHFGHSEQFKIYDVSDGKTAVIRPEFITVRKKNEFNPYPVTKEEGVVERVSFRGNGLELRIRVHDEILIANRQIGQEMVSEGEHVNVFLHKIYLVDDNAGKVEVIVNHAVRNNESVVIWFSMF